MASARDTFDNEAKLRIASLTNSPGWADLQRLMDALYEEDVTRVGRLALQGNTGDARELAIRRGYWLGIRHLLREPMNAHNALERELAKHEKG